MIPRTLESELKERAKKIPVIAILGPRQSGKTTLAKATFPFHAYVSLENYDEREAAIEDPRGFLSRKSSPHGIILDEIQHVPKLLSYIQTLVDEQPQPGYFVLTGSQNILVNEAISQTLAGRITLLTLLPFSTAELADSKLLPERLEQFVFQGGYPRVYAQDLVPTQWYLDYIETYVERDVRQAGKIGDLTTFRRFIRLCAGRVGQLLNLTSLADDCGVDLRTAKSWISILEATYIIFLLQPHHVNFNKRLIKSPKIFFYDSGLVCALLGVQSVEQLQTFYARGSLVETAMIAEILKRYYNRGMRPHDVYFWRDQSGNEIDCMITRGARLVPIEIKAGYTINQDFFKGLTFWKELAKDAGAPGYVLYAGDESQKRSIGTAVSWKEIDSIFE